MSESQSDSELLTPKDWRHVGVYPCGSLYELRGRCHSMRWFPSDLYALGLDPNLRTKRIRDLQDAIRTGQQIEDAMKARVPGATLRNPSSRPVAAVNPALTSQTDDEQESPAVGLVAPDETSLTPATQQSEAVSPVASSETSKPIETPRSPGRDDLAKLMEGKKRPDPAKESLPPAFIAPLPDPKQPDLFA